MSETPTDTVRSGHPKREPPYIGPVLDSHHRALAEFFRESWDGDSNERSVAVWRQREAAENPAEPGVEPPKWVFARADRILGYLGSIPERFWVQGREFPAYWLKGFWVHPEFRSGPVGFEILKVAVATLGATAVSTVAPEARRLFDAQGLVDRGVLFNRVKLLRPGRILRNVDAASASSGLPSSARGVLRLLQRTGIAGIAGASAGAAVSAVVSVRGRTPRMDVRVGWSTLPPGALDALWSELCPSIRAAPVRDGAMVPWRYGDPDQYQCVSIWDNGSLRGWAVVKRPSRAADGRLRGLSIASLSDLLFPPAEPDVGRAVIRAAESVARDLDADGILCSGTHAVLAEQLGRRGFLSVPGNVHFMARDDDERAFGVPIEEWWVTRGDAQSDGSF